MTRRVPLMSVAKFETHASIIQHGILHNGPIFRNMPPKNVINFIMSQMVFC